MGIERRQEPRLKKWFDGGWSGASGGSRCRISDVSVSGCFVNALAEPGVGERTTIAIDLSPCDSISLEGDVVYVDRAMGFGVRFRNVSPEHLTQLRRLFDTHQTATA